MLEDFKGKSVFDLNAQRDDELARQRDKYRAEHGRDDLLKEVRRLIAVPEAVPAAKVRRLGRLAREIHRWKGEILDGRSGHPRNR